LRIENDLTQAEFAVKIGKIPSVMSGWERGKIMIGVPTLKKICDVFDIEWDYFNI